MLSQSTEVMDLTCERVRSLSQQERILLQQVVNISDIFYSLCWRSQRYFFMKRTVQIMLQTSTQQVPYLIACYETDFYIFQNWDLPQKQLRKCRNMLYVFTEAATLDFEGERPPDKGLGSFLKDREPTVKRSRSMSIKVSPLLDLISVKNSCAVNIYLQCTSRTDRLGLLKRIAILNIIILKMEKDLALKYNAYQTKSGNTIWAGALGLAWTDFAETNSVKAISLKTNNPDVVKKVGNFNNAPFQLKDIDAKSVYVKTGLGAQTQDIINKQMKDKFPNSSFKSLSYNLQPSDIISFGYLSKQLNFNAKFQRRSDPKFYFNEKLVKSFYAGDQIQKKQIKVYQYKNQDHFCIHIGDRITNDILFIVKNTKITTIDQAINLVQKVENKGSPVAISKRDEFEMPVIQIDCSHNHKQIVGLKFANQQLSKYAISVMLECLKLKVDESGAKVENKGVIVATKSCVKSQSEVRYFILNKTFWIIMKEAKRHPYVCVQIVNPIDFDDIE